MRRGPAVPPRWISGYSVRTGGIVRRLARRGRFCRTDTAAIDMLAFSGGNAIAAFGSSHTESADSAAAPSLEAVRRPSPTMAPHEGELENGGRWRGALYAT